MAPVVPAGVSPPASSSAPASGNATARLTPVGSCHPSAIAIGFVGSVEAGAVVAGAGDAIVDVGWGPIVGAVVGGAVGLAWQAVTSTTRRPAAARPRVMRRGA